MIIKKTQRRLFLMLIGLSLVIILFLLGLFDFTVLPIYAFLLGLVIVIYFIYVFQFVTNIPYFTIFKVQRKILYSIIDYFSVFVSVIIVVQLLFNYVFFPATVKMSSMNPLLFENDRIIVFNGTENIDRFDIVVFEVDTDIQVSVSKNEDNSLWVKRVIGLPGERIDFVDGLLYVNNQRVYEHFLYDENGKFHHNDLFEFYSLTPNFQMEDILELTNLEGNVIPPDYYLLLGDNRAYSHDANEIGLVHKSQIIGEGKYLVKGIFSFEKIGG